MTADPARVPVRKLNGGALMPAIGLGTFGSDCYSAAEVATAVAGALEVGYRHFGGKRPPRAEVGKAIVGYAAQPLGQLERIPCLLTRH